MQTRLDHALVTTANELPGFRVVKNLGLVRGIVVRSRSILGSLGAGLQTIIGGNISLFSELCEKTRVVGSREEAGIDPTADLPS